MGRIFWNKNYKVKMHGIQFIRRKFHSGEYYPEIGVGIGTIGKGFFS